MGKGTYSSRVADYFGLDCLTTGELVRDEMNSGSELGREVGGPAGALAGGVPALGCSGRCGWAACRAPAMPLHTGPPSRRPTRSRLRPLLRPPTPHRCPPALAPAVCGACGQRAADAGRAHPAHRAPALHAGARRGCERGDGGHGPLGQAGARGEEWLVCAWASLPPAATLPPSAGAQRGHGRLAVQCTRSCLRSCRPSVSPHCAGAQRGHRPLRPRRLPAHRGAGRGARHARLGGACGACAGQPCQPCRLVHCAHLALPRTSQLAPAPSSLTPATGAGPNCRRAAGGEPGPAPGCEPQGPGWGTAAVVRSRWQRAPQQPSRACARQPSDQPPRARAPLQVLIEKIMGRRKCRQARR